MLDSLGRFDGLFVGIDPGKKGHIAEICGASVVCHKMPVAESGDFDVVGMASLARAWRLSGVERITIEKQQSAYIGDTNTNANFMVRPSFMIGYGYGLWIGMFAAFGLLDRVVVPIPAVWKRALGLKSPKGEKDAKKRKDARKNAAVDLCASIFPDVDLRATARSKKLSADKAEALLLAHFGKTKKLDTSKFCI